jgi:hypothetical protein
MITMVMKRMGLACVFLGVTAAAVPVCACSVPVFRYALERWKADPYEFVVFHRGPLAPDQQEIVDAFGPKGAIGSKSANVSLRTVDLDAEPDEEMQALWAKQNTETLPFAVTRYPEPVRRKQTNADLWSGPLTQSSIDGLVDSPARREIARRILKGETVVWAFVDATGADKAASDKAHALLIDQLKAMTLKLKLPEIDKQDILDGLVSPAATDLKLKFSVVRISRDNAVEQGFVDMLTYSEEDGTEFTLSKLADKPMAFPIFGRGRALYALVGAGINPDTIEEACGSLIAPCTCQVKEKNEDGADLLMAVDWDGLVETTIDLDKELPPLTGPGSGIGAETDDAALVPVAPEVKELTAAAEVTPAVTSISPKAGSTPSAVGERISSLVMNITIVLAIGLALVIGGSVFVVAKTKKG